MPGAADFIVAVMLRWESLAGPSGGLVYNIANNVGIVSGWEMNIAFGGVAVQAWDGAGIGVQAVMGGTWWDGTSGLLYQMNRDVVFYLRAFQSGGVLNVEGLVNGVRMMGPTAGANPGMSPSLIGIMSLLGGVTPWSGGAHGIAYFEGTATDDELLEHADLCLGQGRLVAGSIAWNNLFDADDETPGALWAPTLGVDLLTRSGNPTLFTRYLNRG